MAKTVGHTDFNEHERDRALLALALCAGNRVRAREMLKQDTTLHRVPGDRVIAKWKDQNPQRYSEFCEQHAPQVEQGAIENFREIVVRGQLAVLDGIDRTHADMPNLNGKDASAAAKNIGVTVGIATEKLHLMTDRPTSRTEHADPAHVLTGLLNALGIPQTINSTADEIPSEVALIPESAVTNPREQLAGDSLSG